MMSIQKIAAPICFIRCHVKNSFVLKKVNLQIQNSRLQKTLSFYVHERNVTFFKEGHRPFCFRKVEPQKLKFLALKTPKYLFLREWSPFLWSRPAILERPYCFWTFKRKIRNSWLRKRLSTYYRQRDVTAFKVVPPFWINHFVFEDFDLKFKFSNPWNNRLQIFKLFHQQFHFWPAFRGF